MAAYVTEFGGYQSGRPYGYLKEPSLATTVISSGGTVSTATLTAGTAFVEIYATANVWALFTNSATSTTVATATNSEIVPAGTLKVRAVAPGTRYTVLST